MGRIIEYPKSKFIYHEDEFMECECEKCGWCSEEDFHLTCPECKSEDIINYSCNEGCVCESCDHEFEIWEDCYTLVIDCDITMICKDCYNKLEEE